MTTTEPATKTVQVHRVYIKATPQAVWDAITSPEWNRRYAYRTASEYDLRPGGAYRVLTTPEMREHGAPHVCPAIVFRPAQDSYIDETPAV